MSEEGDERDPSARRAMADGDDDDWFERALREREGGEGDADDPGEDTADADAPADAPTAAGTEDAVDAEEARDDPAASSDGDASGAPAPDTSDDLFGDDFATAFENAGSPGVPGDDAGGAGGTGGFDAADGFGGPDFGASGDAFGGGEPFGESFDDAEFESEIPRIDIGIEGLDSMILGGVPNRSLMVAIGSAGTGKTTFALQFLHEALVNGESAVYITLEESYERIVDTATEKGWAFDEYVENDQLAVVDLDPIEMANTLTSIRGELPELIADFGATRLVLDSVSLLEMMYDDQAVRRNEVFDFTESLKEAGVTTMLTSEADGDNPYASRFGIIEYLTDAVFVLRYIRGSDDFRETRLAIEIQKIRDANHSREIKPYEITDGGISVYGQANIF